VTAPRSVHREPRGENREERRAEKTLRQKAGRAKEERDTREKPDYREAAEKRAVSMR
jgi:hypothetical protein